MALQGFLGPNSYTEVTIGRYNQNTRDFTFDATTYETSDKVEILEQKTYQVKALEDGMYSIVWEKDVTEIPTPHHVGDTYLVGNISEGPGQNSEGRIVEYLGNGSWATTSCADGHVVHVSSTDTYYERKSGEWLEKTNTTYTKNKWDEDFGSLDPDEDSAPLTQAAYDYLKTLPEFAGTTDI